MSTQSTASAERSLGFWLQRWTTLPPDRDPGIREGREGYESLREWYSGMFRCSFRPASLDFEVSHLIKSVRLSQQSEYCYFLSL